MAKSQVSGKMLFMATYCIGDVQGCFTELMRLLELIDFDERRDTLWFVGDLVNRGPNSLEVLRYVKQLVKKIVVLGNHDLHLLVFYHQFVNFESESLQAIIEADDCDELLAWLRRCPLFHFDSELNYVLAHAGLYPGWDLATTQRLAAEAEQVLRSDNYEVFLQHLYGNQPNKWNEELQDWDRLRFIVNSLTRMRFCSLDGELDFSCVGKVGSGPEGFVPWFKIPWRKSRDQRIVFGHWAALEGETNEPNVFALDTGCLWGGALTAMRLEDQKLFSCSCAAELGMRD